MTERVVLETARMILREFTPDDVEDAITREEWLADGR